MNNFILHCLLFHYITLFFWIKYAWEKININMYIYAYIYGIVSFQQRISTEILS